MSWPDSIVVATFLGPLLAVVASVLFTIWYQERKQRLDSKEGIFKTLMVYRGTSLVPVECVNALNLIDVEFADNRKVVDLWHHYYSLVCQSQVNWVDARHVYLDLLWEIAKSLGYKHLSQTDIDKFYCPQGHAQLWDLDLGTVRN